MNLLGEHDYEPIPGLPGALPKGEFIRWQGRPDWRDLAISALHVRKLAVYFVALLGLRTVIQWRESSAWLEWLQGTAGLALLALIALGLLCLLAWLMARASLYTITNRRIVIRGGVALPITVNLPFSQTIAANFRQRGKGFGDIPVAMARETQPSWMILWPHVRPWHLGHVQPMLRSLANAQEVAVILSDALREFAEQGQPDTAPVRVSQDNPVHNPVNNSAHNSVHNPGQAQPRKSAAVRPQDLQPQDMPSRALQA